MCFNYCFVNKKWLRKQSIIFIKEIYFKPPKKYSTYKTDVYNFDHILSLDILDLNVHNPKNNRGHRYVLVVIDKFFKFGWTDGSKRKKSQTIETLSTMFFYLQKANQFQLKQTMKKNW